jgi:hypothetical protein
MKFKAPLVIALVMVSLHAYSLARAEGHAQGRAEGRGQARAEGRNEARPNLPPRPAPERFQAHPPGAHPHGPIVRPHPTRVLTPKVVRYGDRQWRHWAHPEFSRPVYFWDWAIIHSVTCIAEDSYGDQYPVTEETFAGFGLVNMTAVEDDALDRCAAESGGDPSCYLTTCSSF